CRVASDRPWLTRERPGRPSTHNSRARFSHRARARWAARPCEQYLGCYPNGVGKICLQILIGLWTRQRQPIATQAITIHFAIPLVAHQPCRPRTELTGAPPRTLTTVDPARNAILCMPLEHCDIDGPDRDVCHL